MITYLDDSQPKVTYLDEDEKSVDTMDALKKTYAHTVEPGIQYLQGLAPMAVQGLGNVAGTIASGGDTKFASELGEEVAGQVPQLPATDVGKEKTEALGHYIQKMKKFGGDVLQSKRAILPGPMGILDLVNRLTNTDEASARGAGELIGELGPQAMVFGAARRGARRPQYTPEELEAARRADQPPVQPEYQPRSMPLKPGEQGELFVAPR